MLSEMKKYQKNFRKPFSPFFMLLMVGSSAARVLYSDLIIWHFCLAETADYHKLSVFLRKTYLLGYIFNISSFTTSPQRSAITDFLPTAAFSADSLLLSESSLVERDNFALFS